LYCDRNVPFHAKIENASSVWHWAHAQFREDVVRIIVARLAIRMRHIVEHLEILAVPGGRSVTFLAIDRHVFALQFEIRLVVIESARRTESLHVMALQAFAGHGALMEILVAG
jgi:hypothetical protein